MATDETGPPHDAAALSANLAKIEDLSQRLMAALAHKRPTPPGLQAPQPELFVRAASAYWAEAMLNPARLFEQQLGYWGKTLQNFSDAGQRADEQQDSGHGTADPAAFMDFLDRQYRLNLQTMNESLANTEYLDEHERQRARFFAREIMKLFRPDNFLGTNPEALARAQETNGRSLVDGLENLVRDLEANDGELVVSLADRDAFSVGRNLATTEGAVVYRNRLFELIQYAPRTPEVHQTPLLIFPPWINKFYILDLNERNSLIRWLVGQGYTVFIVSWVNPDGALADVGMADYIEEGFLQAIAQVKSICRVRRVNAVGYCIAGTTLALSLALMEKRGDKSVKSASFFTTLTDFSDPGDVGVFLADDFMQAIRDEVARKGVLDALYMARTFSFLRSDDLIYKPAVRRYLLGEAPPAFDLLYWNGDSTNLPGRMAVEYLEYLCRENRFAEGRMELLGETLSLQDVRLPLYAIACETDHIAPWASSFTGLRQMGSSDKTFLLSQSGHIAGIVNPPTRNKYGHFTNEAPCETCDAWKAGAAFHEGSWWPRWESWLAQRSGKMVAARRPGTKRHPVLEPAPGRYVRMAAHEKDMP